MRIALLLSGQPRFCNNFDTFLSNLRGYSSVDWFCSFWDKSQGPDKFGYNDHVLVAEKWRAPELVWARDTIQKNLPEGHVLRDLELADQSLVEVPSFATNLAAWYMFVSLNNVSLLKERAETLQGRKYDLIVRARPDLGLVAPLDLTQCHPDKVTAPNYNWHGHGYTICDMMGIGSSDVMSKYASVSKNASELIKHISFHPETLLAYNLHTYGIPIHRAPWICTNRSDSYKTTDNMLRVPFGRWE